MQTIKIIAVHCIKQFLQRFRSVLREDIKVTNLHGNYFLHNVENIVESLLDELPRIIILMASKSIVLHFTGIEILYSFMFRRFSFFFFQFPRSLVR